MNDIDLLFARIEEINAKSPPYPAQDIDDIIVYHRLLRARRASGEKPVKATVDISKILGPSLAQPAVSKPTVTPSPFSRLRL